MIDTRYPALLVEAFTDRACAGNGAGVVLLNRARPSHWMQAVAGSLRQSETAFLLKADQHQATWMLRWFTPTCEVPLCGHATLAALVALQLWRLAAPGLPVGFLTRSGRLPGSLHAGPEPMGTIELPAGRLEPAQPPAGLEEVVLAELGASILGFWRACPGYAVALLPPGAPLATMAPIAPRLVGDLRQGLVLMQALTDLKRVPQVAAAPADYQLRFFAPALGIEEDPVTGSAHALVASLWFQWLGKDTVRGWQCSDRPGGMVCNRRSSGMIALTGAGYVLWEGFLSAPPAGFGDQLDDGGWRSLAGLAA